MYATAECGALLIKTKTGTTFQVIEEEGKLKVTLPNDRIMYGTEEGNDTAEYILLIK